MLKKYLANNIIKEIAGWLLTIILIFAAYILLRSFVCITINISGNSMEPTLSHSDRVLLSKVSYIFKEPEYNDIIAFPFQKDFKQVYVKRIIGLPGDTIDLVNHQFVINGSELDDAFAKEIIAAEGNIKFPVVVPEGCYFVLGDNRNVSKDSRYGEVGFIQQEDIIGKAVLRIMPFSRFGTIPKQG